MKTVEEMLAELVALRKKAIDTANVLGWDLDVLLAVRELDTCIATLKEVMEDE